MSADKAGFVEKTDRHILWPLNTAIPKEPLFQDLERRVLSEIERIANLRNKPAAKIIQDRINLTHTVIEVLFMTSKCRGQDACMAFPTSSHGHSRKAGKGLGSHTTVKLLLAALKSLNWVDVDQGGKTESGDNVITTIVPTGELLSRFEKQPLLWRYAPPAKDHQDIVVKNRDPITRIKYKLPYFENNKTRNIAKRVRTINKFMSQHAIALALDAYDLETLAIRMAGYKSRIEWAKSRIDPVHYGAYREPRLLNQTAIHLRRIFSRDSFGKGGRHFGAFYQNIVKEYRSAITIDGQPTLELDFAELHPRIMYALAGKSPPPGDLYDIWLPRDGACADKTDPTYKRKRKLIKILVNGLINDEYGSFDLSAANYEELGLKRHQIMYRLHKKHPLLGSIKGRGMGLEYQYVESEIADLVMTKLLEQGIVCLPIYDSFRVQTGYEFQLREAMITTYKAVLGTAPEISDPEMPREPDEMPVYPTIFRDDDGKEYQMTDWTYQRNLRKTSPYHLYLEGFWNR